MNETELTIVIVSVVVIALLLLRILGKLSQVVRKLECINNTLSDDVDVNADARQMKKQYKMFLSENEGVENLPHKERHSQFRVWVETQPDMTNSL